MAFSLLRKVNEKVLNSVSLLDASLDVDYIIADIENSINNNKIEKIEDGINSLIDFSEKNKNVLMLQRQWIGVVFRVIKWMGNNINKQVFGNILQLIIKMIEDNNKKSLLIKCCNFEDNISSNIKSEIENNKIIEEIIKISKGGIVLLETLNNLRYEKTDIYIKYDIVKILCIIKKSNLGDFKLDEIILSQGDNIGLLLELLSDGLKDHSYYLHNSLKLLMLLTRSNNEVQKMITYNGSIQQIINILSDEIQLFNKKDRKIKFVNCENILNIFLDIRDNKLEMDSNIEILQMCIEIIYHIINSNNCLKYIIESQVNEEKKFIEVIIELLGFCFLFLEYNIYEYEKNRRGIFNNNNNDDDDELNNDENRILVSIISRIVDIFIKYFEINKEFDSIIFKNILDILFCVFSSTSQIKFKLLEKIITFLNNVEINDNFNFEWCTLMYTSGLNPTIWYGYNKIILDYKPTINYITENNKIDNQEHINQLLELKDKYMNQMENTLLEWLGNIIMPRCFFIKELIKRDDWLFNILKNTKFRLFSFDKLTLNKDILFQDFILLCFWFPITEFQRLWNKSFFSKLQEQISVDIYNLNNEENKSLTLLFHYRLFRLLQLMQILLFNKNIEIKEDLNIKDITKIIFEIWDVKYNEDNDIYSNKSFYIEFINKVMEIGKLMIIEINEILDSEFKKDFLEFINNYGIKNNFNYFNSITTLIQIIILLILCNSRQIEFEILNSFLQDIKELDEKIKDIMNNDDYTLISDIIFIFLYRFDMTKNTNLLNKIYLRFKVNKYEGVLIEHSYMLILHTININNRGIIYKHDHLNLDYKKNESDLFESNLDNDLNGDVTNCINCIYLNEKMFNERKNLLKIIKKKQEEINILVKAYINSQNALKMNNNNLNEDNEKIRFKDICIDSSDYYNLLEILGILERKFPFIKKFIENNFIISPEMRSEMSFFEKENILQNIEYELLTDSEEIICKDIEDKNDSMIFEDEKIFNF